MEKIFYLTVQECGKNTKKATLVEWHVPNKSAVKETDVVCALETTKATFDIEAGKDGYIHFLAEPGQELKIGEPLAIIHKTLLDDKELQKLLDKKNKTKK
ncbi:MAG: lipoyl domain-containing protein [bacterium]